MSGKTIVLQNWTVIFNINFNYIDDGFLFFQDLFIGNHLIFCKHPFVLIDCDEYAIRYMEAHAHMFPQSSVKQILPKLKELTDSSKDEFKQFLETTGEHSSFEQFR